VIDGAQSVPHIPVNVGELGCDFLAFSSHKMLGPMGVGVLWGRRELLDAMPAYQADSNMAHDVDLAEEHLSSGALKFGAGTPNVSGPVGLATAIEFLQRTGPAAMHEHEQHINARMFEHLNRMPAVRVLGSRDTVERISVFSFVVRGVAPHDLVTRLDADGVAIRAGDLASRPLLTRLGVTAAARASCYLYTSDDDVDRFVDALARAIRA
jgi:cysteine desulfurase/selenocysteine lyase